MKFKTIVPTDNEIKIIAEIILRCIGAKNMASEIIKIYPDKFDLFMKDFNYQKYIAADTDERQKWNFIPTEIYYISGNNYDKHAVKSIVNDINTVILYKAIMKSKRASGEA